MREPGQWKIWVGSLLCGGAYLQLAYFTPRSAFMLLLSAFALAFVGYGLLYRSGLGLKTAIALALLFRLIFFFALPALSDDYFRFIWDGTLVANGLNPFVHTPDFYLSGAVTEIPGLSPELYRQLNSPGYFSVYPPVCQAVFGLAVLVGGQSYWLSCLVMRFFILAAEAGTFYLLICLLRHYRQPEKQVLLYALNPLVIAELTGNLHFEALMITMLLLSLSLLVRGKANWSAGALGLAVSVKLLPLLFLPLLLRRLGWRCFLTYAAITGLVVLALFLPFFSPDLLNVFASLNLYFQKFEFNAGFYYLLRWLGFQAVGYNLIARIGPALSFLTFAWIMYLAWSRRQQLRPLPTLYLSALTVYLFGALIVHPWYLTTLIALAVLTPWRFPLLWSGLVLFSYAAYQTDRYQENLVLVALEYLLLLGYLLWEWRQIATVGANKPLKD